MIARVWSGAVRRADGDAYAAYVLDTGLAGYAATPGNRGAWLLRRDEAERTEFVAFTLWDSLEAISAFPGDGDEAAACGPEDERYLIERAPTVTLFEVAGSAA